MSWMGLEWPQADEEVLAEAGQAWIAFGSQIGEVSGPVSAAAARVWAKNTGDTSDAFEAWWNADGGPPKRLGDDAAAAFLIGGALIAFSIVTLITKISIIVQLITLLILIAQAVISAFFTFGATVAETPGIIAASRVLIRKLLTTLLEHVQSVVRDVLEKARGLLKPGTGQKLLERIKANLGDDIGAIGPGVGDLKFARAVRLPANSAAVVNRAMKVTDFISQFRNAGIRGQIPGEFLEQSVEQALRSGNSTVRKLLTDGRWTK